MTYLVLFLLFAGICIFWMILNLPPKKIAALLMNSGPIFLMGVGGALTLFQRWVFGVPLMLVGLSWWRRTRGMRPPTYSDGRKSTVSSVYLKMELDHDTGEMEGWVLTGRMEGASLSSLSETEIISLYNEISDDADSVSLLESFLDRYHPEWREWQNRNSSSTSGGTSNFDSMTREEAFQILGLKPGASPEEIHQAWRRLVKAVHPDSGGSAFLTAKINAARDLLLG